MTPPFSLPNWSPPSGRTLVAGVIGDPVEQSLSPALFNAAFAHLGLDWVYVAFPVAAGEVAAAVAGARALGLQGLSVTMPHKQAAALAADVRSPAVELLGAANTLVLRSDGVHAHSTDGEGLLADLADVVGFDPAGRRCVVLGAGGAARAVVLALAGARAASVVVVNRTAATAASAAALAGDVGRVGSDEDVADADLVVKATPVGMEAVDARAGDTRAADDSAADDSAADDTARLTPGARLHPGQLAVDLVYAPAVTPFLSSAAEAGAATRGGLGMLVRQAALQLELWTGQPAPVEAMWEALRGAEGTAGTAVRGAEGTAGTAVRGGAPPDAR